MTETQVISIDGMGGDDGAQMVIAGIERFAKSNLDTRFLVFGDESVLKPLLDATQHAKSRSEIRHTDKSVSMEAKPAQAVRQGKGTSMWGAIEAVKKGEASAVVSAGNTGALMAMAKLILRTMEGIHRPALCASWPTERGLIAVLDLGADITADAEQLAEFAIMGDAFAKAVHHKKEPSVALLNIGSEDMKGNDTLRYAASMLNEPEMTLNYIGFVEGNDISFGKADVIVTDGFTGNVALKTAEGAVKLIGQFLRESLTSSLFGKIGALIAKPALNRLKEKIDPRQANGAVFLGLKGIVVKSHGGTDAFGFEKAISVAADMGSCHFAEFIEPSLARLKMVVEENEKKNLSETEAAE
ncbi:phosphate acyltransferase PlsX [Hirschia baltica]|uniref:Phosphate acyltransferase n=1 Tax=Hirschia baltica (strain ATCC 49814 / DSM 5838 / IFAM 1418) TaxID=582402 RepID=C6XIY0_HIRBI|nr:phosphate acyltransferase PlsX [Hirschia baltica]ACT59075.1 fatty acid/phospholipid synthesis protein PlsX [Hirschia baltica ATCC 49814]